MPRLCGPWFAAAALICMVGLRSSAEQLTAEPQATPQQEHASRTDLYGDPLPLGAIARMGTVRWRHGASITALTFSPCGTLLATGGSDRTIRLWHVPTGREQLRLVPSKDDLRPTNLLFSVDGSILASHWYASRGRSTHVWRVSDGKLLLSLLADDQRNWISSFAFSPDAKRLALGHMDRSLAVWDLDTAKQVARHKSGRAFAKAVAFLSDENIICLGLDDDLALQMWNAVSGKLIHLLQGHTAPVQCAVFSPDLRTAVSGGGDNTIRIWSVSSGKQLATIKGHTDKVTTLTFSQNGQVLASASTDDTIRLWMPITGEQQLSITSSLARNIGLSPDGKLLAEGASSNSAIRFWNTATGNQMLEHGHCVGATELALSPDGLKLYSLGADRLLHTWDRATSRPLFFPQQPHHYSSVLAVSPDSRLLVRLQRAKIILTEFATGKQLWQTDFQGGKNSLATFSSDGRFLAIEDYPDNIINTVIRVFDTQTGRQRWAFKGQKDRLADLRFSPTDNCLASASSDSLHVWNLQTGSQIPFQTPSSSGVWSLGFSQDGKILACVESRDRISLYELLTGKRIYNLGAGSVLRFSGNGKLLAVGNREGTVLLWDIRTNKKVLEIAGHNGRIRALIFSPDDSTLSSASDDTTVLTWDLLKLVRLETITAKHYWPLKPQELWTNLGSDDAAIAYRALWGLVSWGDDSIDFLANRVLPVPLEKQPEIDTLIKQLDNPRFQVRDAATQALRECGPEIEPILGDWLNKDLSAEMRERITHILASMRGQPHTQDYLRIMRAIHVLEHLNTQKARKHLELVATGSPRMQRTLDAKMALQRVCGRTW